MGSAMKADAIVDGGEYHGRGPRRTVTTVVESIFGKFVYFHDHDTGGEHSCTIEEFAAWARGRCSRK